MPENCTINIKCIFFPKMQPEQGEMWSLQIINEILTMNSFSLQDFDLPVIENLSNFQLPIDECNIQLLNNNNDNEEQINIDTLTSTQKKIFDSIIEAVNNVNVNRNFFIDGPGGSGKTYLLNVLIDYFKLNKISVLSVA